MELFNFQTGKLEDVGDENVTEAISSGVYGAKKGSFVPVVLEDGRKGQLPAENVFQNFSTGAARFYTKEERDEDALDEELSGAKGFLLAGTTAALSGATLGLSDQFLTKTNIVDEARLAKAREKWGATSLAAETLGVIAPLLTGPAGVGALTAKGAAKTAISTIGTPVKLANRAGVAVEKALTKKLGRDSIAKGSVEGILRSVGPKAAGSIVEGALYGAGHLVSEEALGNTEFTAESILSNVGAGSMFGGLVGVGFNLPGAIATRQALKISDKFKNAAQDVSELAAKSGVKEKASEYASWAARNTRRADEKSIYFDGDLSDYTDLEVLGALSKDVSPAEFRYALRNKAEVDGAPTLDKFSAEVDRGLRSIDNSIKEISNGIKDVIEKGRSIEFVDGQIKRSAIPWTKENSQQLVDEINKSIRRVKRSKAPGETVDDDVISFLEDLKSGYIDKSGQPVQGNIALKRIYRQIQTLTNPKDYKRFKNVEQLPGEVTREAKKLRGFIRNQLADLAPEVDMPLLALSDLIKAREGAIEIFKNAAKRTGGVGRKIDSLYSDKIIKNSKGQTVRGVDDDLQKLLDFEAASGVDLERMYKNRLLWEKLNVDLMEGVGKDDIKNFGTIIVGSTTGALSIAQAGARIRLARSVLGQARGFVGNQILKDQEGFVANAAKRLGGIEKMSRETFGKIKDKASGFSSKIKDGKSTKTRTPVRLSVPSTAPTFFSFLNPNESGDEKANYKDFANNLASIASNPQAAIREASEKVEPLRDIAPRIADDMIRTSMLAINYLNSVLPETQMPNGLRMESINPSEIDFSTYKNIVRTVQSPLSVLDDLDNGSISPKQVEALKFVYPNLYEEMKNAYLDEISQIDKKIPYNDALNLSIFLEIPLHFSLNPQRILDLQNRFVPQEGQPSQDIQRPSALGKSKIKERNRTDIERINISGVGED